MPKLNPEHSNAGSLIASNRLLPVVGVPINKASADDIARAAAWYRSRGEALIARADELTAVAARIAKRERRSKDKERELLKD